MTRDSEQGLGDTNPEARKHRRFSVDVEATVTTPTNQSLTARTRDVSKAGICLVTTEAVVIGLPLSVDLVLAFGDNAFSEPLRLEAKVVWCTPIGHSFQIGAMFDELTEEQDNFLEMFLQFLDGTLAPRGGENPADDEDDVDIDDDLPVSPDTKDDPFRA